MNSELQRRIADRHEERQARLEQAIEMAARGTEPDGHDSPARRQALKQHLEGLNLSPQEIASRLLIDIGQPRPISKAIERSQQLEREEGQRRIRERGVERGREAPGRER
jgi:hypothetical protein